MTDRLIDPEELAMLRRKAKALDWIQATNPTITMLPPYWQIETVTFVTLRPTLLEAIEDAMRDEPDRYSSAVLYNEDPPMGEPDDD